MIVLQNADDAVVYVSSSVHPDTLKKYVQVGYFLFFFAYFGGRLLGLKFGLV